MTEPSQELPVYRADVHGDGHYFTRDDLEWWVPPGPDEPGVLCPRSWAIPRDVNGIPVHVDDAPWDRDDDLG